MTVPRPAFDRLLLQMVVPTDALARVPAMLPEDGALVKLWRADPIACRAHEVVREYHIGFDLVPWRPEMTSFLQPTLLANPKELPA